MDDTGAAMAPLDAVRELRALSAYDAALRQRMEGVLWMIAGLATSCIFLAYSLAIVTDAPAGVLGVLWIPWIGSGVLVLWGLRKGLSLPLQELDVSGALWTFGGFALACLLGFVGFLAVGSEAAPGIALLAFSAVALLPTLLPRLGFTPLGRRVSLVLAALGIVSGIVTLLTGSGDAGAWSGASMGVVWVLGGVYQVIQG